jgi:hypothetical protein
METENPLFKGDFSVKDSILFGHVQAFPSLPHSKIKSHGQIMFLG